MRKKWKRASFRWLVLMLTGMGLLLALAAGGLAWLFYSAAQRQTALFCENILKSSAHGEEVITEATTLFQRSRDTARQRTGCQGGIPEWPSGHVCRRRCWSGYYRVLPSSFWWLLDANLHGQPEPDVQLAGNEYLFHMGADIYTFVCAFVLRLRGANAPLGPGPAGQSGPTGGC